MHFVFAQINTTVGDIAGNSAKVRTALDAARAALAAETAAAPAAPPPGLVFAVPELAVLGYPPKDLILKEGLVERCEAAVADLARLCTGPVVGLIPSPRRRERASGTGVANSLAICRNGRVEGWYDKRLLPTYDVFDEDRYFDPGDGPQMIAVPDGDQGALRIGLTLCEDLWIDEGMLTRRLYAEDTVADLLAHPDGPPDVILNCSASPFVLGKPVFRVELFRRIAKRAACPVAFVNMVGGNDDLVFDGHSFWLDAAGSVVEASPGFQEHTIVVDWSPGTEAVARSADSARDQAVEAVGRATTAAANRRRSKQAAAAAAATGAEAAAAGADAVTAGGTGPGTSPSRGVAALAGNAGPGAAASAPRRPIPVSTRAELEADDDGYPPAFESEHNLRDLFHALVLGTRDYLHKCGFDSAIVALSGGIDSALVAAIAVAALGPDRVHGIGMPSRYSSQGSIDDARDLSERLHTRFDLISIEPAHRAMLDMMQPLFEESGRPPGVAEENIQARLRGNIVMSWSNKVGAMLLTTGNKSEIAVGYCTLYGDMAGGLAVISDVPKTVVYDLCRFINHRHDELGFSVAPIPDNILTKAPSAELRPNQTDQDSLPPYPVLDAIIFRYVERLESVERIIAQTNFDPEVVRRTCQMIDRNEYKRRQMPTGLKVTGRAFGTGWRMPIAARVTTG